MIFSVSYIYTYLCPSSPFIYPSVCYDSKQFIIFFYKYLTFFVEVGAHFLEEIVKQFSSIYSSTNLNEESDKRMDNLILLLAYHFNFR